MPLAVESFDLSAADLVISSSSAVAKGVLTHGQQLHICYCYTPARYAWDLTHQYLAAAGLDRGLRSLAARLVLHYLRLWDVANTPRVDHFITSSRHIARRLWHLYRRRSTVIHPPIEVERFTPKTAKEDFYLTVTRLESYKRVDLIVETCARLGRKLVVVGDGPELKKIKAKANPGIEVLGYQPDTVVEDLMQRARGFIFAAEEDFGIALVEAQACGTPVIAYGRGGARETVRGVWPGEPRGPRHHRGVFPGAVKPVPGRGPGPFRTPPGRPRPGCLPGQRRPFQPGALRGGVQSVCAGALGGFQGVAAISPNPTWGTWAPPSQNCPLMAPRPHLKCEVMSSISAGLKPEFSSPLKSMWAKSMGPTP